MGIRRPAWWCYPERCEQGHEWGPDRVIVSWVSCHCDPAVAANGGYMGAGHRVVYCNAVPGCWSRWYEPRHQQGE